MSYPRPTGVELGSEASVIGSSVTKTILNEVKLQILSRTLSTTPWLEQAQLIYLTHLLDRILVFGFNLFD